MTDEDGPARWSLPAAETIGAGWTRVRLVAPDDDADEDPEDDHVLGPSVLVILVLVLIVGLIWPSVAGSGAAIGFLVLALVSLRMYSAGVFVSTRGIYVRAFPLRLRSPWPAARIESDLSDRRLVRASLVLMVDEGDRVAIPLHLITSRILFGRSTRWRRRAVVELARGLRQLGRDLS